MLSFGKGLKALQMNRKDVSRRTDRILGQTIREAARQWLRAWLAEGVPVETGMAKGTLRPLGRFLRVSVSIKPVRKPYFSVLEGVVQKISSGEEKSEFQIRDDKSDPGSFIYEFHWATEVLHYMEREFYNGSAMVGRAVLHGPATDAFFAQIDKAIAKRLPVSLELIMVDI